MVAKAALSRKSTNGSKTGSRRCDEPESGSTPENDDVYALIERTTTIYVEELRMALDSGEYNLANASETEEKNREIRQRVMKRLARTG